MNDNVGEISDSARALFLNKQLTEMDSKFLKQIRLVAELARRFGTEAEFQSAIELGNALETTIIHLRTMPPNTDAGLKARIEIGRALDAYRASIVNVMEKIQAPGTGNA